MRNSYFVILISLILNFYLINNLLGEQNTELVNNLFLSAPVLISPANNSLNTDINLSLVWGNVTGATSYRLQVSLDASFNTTVVDIQNLTVTTYNLSNLKNNKTYYWRVNAKNQTETSPWSEVWAFTTKVTNHFSFTSATGNNATVLVPLTSLPTINGVTISNNDEIGVYTPAGLCVGGIVLEGVNTAITVWGDNEQTPAIDGILPGEKINYRVWVKNTNTEYTISVIIYDSVFNYTGNYTPNAAYQLNTLRVMPLPANVQLNSPANGSTLPNATPTLKWYSSPNSTSYQLQISTDSLFNNLVLNESNITDTLKNVTNLSTNTKYFWRVKGKNVSGESPSWSAVWSFTTGQSCKELNIVANWNLVAVPLQAANMSKTALFPTATTPAYGYLNGYYTADTLKLSKGYWLKFTDAQNVSICGTPTTINTINVTTGWNLIGVYHNDVQVSQITTSPSGIIVSQFYGYNNGYFTANVLLSGKAYWVKVSQNGTINLP